MESTDDLFSDYSHNYDESLAQGLKFTGEGKSYFAQERISWLARTLAKKGRRVERVLDFGCGTGSTSGMLLQLPGAREVVGVDKSPPLVATAVGSYASSTVRFAVVSEDIPRESFDIVHCSGVFHHVPLGHRRRTALWILQRLRAGGIFALWENNPWNPGTRFVMSRIPFDREAITLSPPEGRALVSDAGFRLVAAEYLFLWPRSLSFLRFMTRYMGRFPLGAQYLVLGQRP